MHFELLAFALVLTVGCGAFLYGVVCLVGRALALLGRGMSWFLFGSDSGKRSRVGGRSAAIRRCGRAGCGHVEHRLANFCARCGSKLDGPGDRQVGDRR